MDDRPILDIDFSEDIAEFTERYSSFSKILNKMQRQYLSLKDTYAEQSAQLQAVNKTLQSLNADNRAVTEFLNSILTSLSSGVIAVNRSGRITHINPAARRILGIENDQTAPPDHNYSEIMNPLEHCEYSALETIKTGGVFDNVEKQIRNRHGTILTLSVSTSLLKSKDGEIIGAVELFSDISKIRRLEEQLSRMKVLASLGEMAASIAHEVRNPLVGISGFASLLSRDLDDKPGMKAMAEKIVSGVNSINRTIQNLLDFARKEEVQKATVNLYEYLSAVLDNYVQECGLHDAEKRLVRELNADDVIEVELDRQLFKQALYNLISNGIEAGGEGTRVTVRCRTLPLARARGEYGDDLELSGVETIAEIKISDNGPGIPTEEIGRIFAPFFSTKENGTGLGLAIAWKIIKAHGGDLKAASMTGKGTTLSIVMPIRTTQ
ncbi:MAG: PAS domain S-box protein [Candidatus Zixiibacteriota bacterium]|nr:MAG: PAS domain S-box protein [candidate division Zixibacteria bacterium]